MAACLIGAAPAQAQQVSRCDSGSSTYEPTVTAPPKYEIGPQENVELKS